MDCYFANWYFLSGIFSEELKPGLKFFLLVDVGVIVSYFANLRGEGQLRLSS